jgi:adenosylcobinamide-GDP ribazoletransferase
MKRLFAAIAFLTRAPLPAGWQFNAADVGRATLFFPLVGAGLGALGAATLFALAWRVPAADGDAPNGLWLPPVLAAVLLVTLGAWLTGALHLDGLADMADGFGGGRTREDVLRIMRDHVIGAYGAAALILLISIKVAALSALIERGAAAPYLILAPTLGRWATVPLGQFLPYARREEGGLGAAATDHVGWYELTGATVLAGTLTLFVAGWRGVLCWAGVIAVTLFNARLCRRRVGGVTGDTLGANTEVCEATVLIIAVALTR